MHLHQNADWFVGETVVSCCPCKQGVKSKLCLSECFPNGTMTALAVKLESVPSLNPSQLVLNDPSCGPAYSDDRYAYFVFTANSCGTNRKVTPICPNADIYRFLTGKFILTIFCPPSISSSLPTWCCMKMKFLCQMKLRWRNQKMSQSMSEYWVISWPEMYPLKNGSARKWCALLNHLLKYSEWCGLCPQAQSVLLLWHQWHLRRGLQHQSSQERTVRRRRTRRASSWNSSGFWYALLCDKV